MKFIIGIDLGTTNSSVSYIDKNKNPFPIQTFRIPQFVSLGRLDSKNTLPSFCYLIEKEEWPQGSLKYPWEHNPDVSTIVGEFAKIKGADVPTRLIQSAKSWLCNSAAHRKDKILPIHTDHPSHRLSPVEVSARYLAHIRDAWNHQMAKGDPSLEFEEQEIILTVPASFDEVARTLTAEAAKLAGCNHLTLLEEPQAAFYSWIASHESQCTNLLKDDETILVCDVGGGTTDFSLIKVQLRESKLSFQRMAVGDHLLLGGDNIDTMLAHHFEKKLLENGHPNLDTTQWHQLLAEARNAKEFLLGPDAYSRQIYKVIIQGTGSSVIKSSMALTVDKEEIESLLLQGFFGLCDLDEALNLKRTQGLKTMGLPYESEPSIIKHMAHFLKQANYINKGVDYLLFNGGTLKPTSFQQAIHKALQHWFPQRSVQILSSNSLDLAVARGAAYYGKARMGQGFAIGGGIPRSYYLEVEVQNHQEKNAKILKALTLLPRGSDDGASYEPEQIFLVRPNQAVSFNLLSSHVRLEDKSGDIIPIDDLEMQRLPPIQTLLRFGKKHNEQNDSIPVHIKINLTAIGTIELLVKSVQTDHVWKLEFQLRGAEGQDANLNTHTQQRQGGADETFDKGYLEEAQDCIEKLYSGSTEIKPETIFEKLESLLQKERREWSPSVLRGLWQTLFKVSAQRKMTMAHEIRWWNLAGFFLRPGYGYPLDDHRIKELWKIILSDLKQSKSNELLIQQYICFRRIAGGLNKGQQMQLASDLMPNLFKVKGRNDRYEYSEKIRMIGSFERLDISTKVRLGDSLLQKMHKNEVDSFDFWALGRIGARQLVYGSIGSVVPKDVCARWIEDLLKLNNMNVKVSYEKLWFPLSQLARKSDHRELNVDEDVIRKVLDSDVEGKIRDRIYKIGELTAQENEAIYGDSLPAGLILINESKAFSA